MYFTTDMDTCPTLPTLMSFGDDKLDISGEIGEQYHRFGIKLLKDSTGAKMIELKPSIIKFSPSG